MLRFIVRRSLEAVAALLAATLLFFTAVFVLPGDPIRALFGFRPPPPEVLTRLRALYGLDQPFHIQYVRYVTSLIQGDLGVSIRGGSVSAIVERTLPTTLRLIGITLVGETLLGLFAGVMATIHEGSWRDRMVRYGTMLLLAFPVFLVAYLAQAVFGVWLDWVPRYPTFADHDSWTSWVLPVTVLVGWFGAYIARLARSQLHLTMHEPFTRALRGHGIPDSRIIGVHALRASLVPTITLVAASVGEMLVALIIVEGIFRIDGLGTVVYTAISTQDRPVIVGVLTITTLIVIIANALADIAYTVIDPRIRLR